MWYITICSKFGERESSQFILEIFIFNNQSLMWSCFKTSRKQTFQTLTFTHHESGDRPVTCKLSKVLKTMNLLLETYQRKHNLVEDKFQTAAKFFRQQFCIEFQDVSFLLSKVQGTVSANLGTRQHD